MINTVIKEVAVDGRETLAQMKFPEGLRIAPQSLTAAAVVVGVTAAAAATVLDAILIRTDKFEINRSRAL